MGYKLIITVQHVQFQPTGRHKLNTMRSIGKSKIVTARRDYGCDACTWISEMYDDIIDVIGTMTFAEKRSIAKAHLNGWRIMKGEKHLTCTIIGCEGEIFTLRVIPEIDAICRKYDIYVYDDMC